MYPMPTLRLNEALVQTLTAGPGIQFGKIVKSTLPYEAKSESHSLRQPAM